MRPCSTRTKNWCYCGLMLVGIGIAIVGSLAVMIVEKMIRSEVNKSLQTIPSTVADSAKHWNSFLHSNSTYCAWLYNITNLDDVLKYGVKFNFSLVGPYCATSAYHRYNVSWDANEETYAYNCYTQLLLNDDAKSQQSKTDMITTVNVPYIKMVSMMTMMENDANELGLYAIFALGTLGRTVAPVLMDFNGKFHTTVRGEILLPYVNTLIATAANGMNLTDSAASQTLATQWNSRAASDCGACSIGTQCVKDLVDESQGRAAGHCAFAGDASDPAKNLLLVSFEAPTPLTSNADLMKLWDVQYSSTYDYTLTTQAGINKWITCLNSLNAAQKTELASASGNLGSVLPASLTTSWNTQLEAHTIASVLQWLLHFDGAANAAFLTFAKTYLASSSLGSLTPLEQGTLMFATSWMDLAVMQLAGGLVTRALKGLPSIQGMFPTLFPLPYEASALATYTNGAGSSVPTTMSPFEAGAFLATYVQSPAAIPNLRMLLNEPIAVLPGSLTSNPAAFGLTAADVTYYPTPSDTVRKWRAYVTALGETVLTMFHAYANSGLFTKRTAYEIMFGYSDPFLATFSTAPYTGLAGAQYKNPEEAFANEHYPRHVRYTGKGNPDKYSVWKAYFGVSNLTKVNDIPEFSCTPAGVAPRGDYKGDCSLYEDAVVVDGMSSSGMAPFQEGSAPLRHEIWATKHRVYPFKLDRDSSVLGVPTRRYYFSPEAFENSGTNPKNRHYRHTVSEDPNGLWQTRAESGMDMYYSPILNAGATSILERFNSSCVFTVNPDTVIPYFNGPEVYLAATPKDFLEVNDGSKQNSFGAAALQLDRNAAWKGLPEDIASQLEINPLTGMAIGGHQRMQLNLGVWGGRYRTTGGPYAKFMKNYNVTYKMYFPIAFQDEAEYVTQADADTLNSVYTYRKVADGLQIGLVLFGLAFFFWALYLRLRKSSGANKVAPEGEDGGIAAAKPETGSLARGAAGKYAVDKQGFLDPKAARSSRAMPSVTEKPSEGGAVNSKVDVVTF